MGRLGARTDLQSLGIFHIFAAVEDYRQQTGSELLRIATERGLLEGKLLQSPDIEEKWRSLAPEFLADAVGEFNSYPEVVLAWAAYLGAAVAFGWDADWESYKERGYSFYCGERGFDYMDEHITEDILRYPLGSDDARNLAQAFSFLASAAMNLLRHSGAEAGSTDAYQAVVYTIDAMFSTGAAVMLHRSGYKYETAF